MYYYLALSEIDGLGVVQIDKLLKIIKFPEELFKLSKKDLKNIGIKSSIIKELLSKNIFKHVDSLIKKSELNGLKIISKWCSGYPDLLSEIYSPPPILYIKGKHKIFKKINNIGVVGTREPDSYGKRVCEKIASDLTSHGINIISGLARGIDAVAHEACLKNGGKTIAVLGTGADIVYPLKNRKLANEICENGALISEFPPGTYAAPFNFPRRNRLISGLSMGTLVVQAKARSGSLITANYALQQNREVFAIPGNIFNPNSEGTFNLIKNGAIPVKSCMDILSSVSIEQDIFKESNNISLKNEIPLGQLSEIEKKIVSEITSNPQTIDDIISKTGISVDLLFHYLLELEIKGFIAQVSGQRYVRI